MHRTPLMKTILTPSSIIRFIFIFFTISCAEKKNESSKGSTEHKLNISVLEKILGKGIEKDGQYKVTVPQNDLSVVVDSFKIIAPMGLSTWAAFAPAGNGAMAMGDIIVTETELRSVQAEVIKQGLDITAVHNHFLRDKPHIMYMHIGGMGSEENLAQGVNAIFEKIKNLRGHNPADGKKDEVQNTMDTHSLDSILGSKGEMSRGVYKQTIGRPDVSLKDEDATVSGFLGFNTWAAWQGTPENAAVAGDFAMLETEVKDVIKTLIENEFEVVAVHNHMVQEKPRIFFLHYWGVGPAIKLANGLKAALDKTARIKSNQSTAFIQDKSIAVCKN
jgi:hypothetical protein